MQASAVHSLLLTRRGQCWWMESLRRVKGNPPSHHNNVAPFARLLLRVNGLPQRHSLCSQPAKTRRQKWNDQVETADINTTLLKQIAELRWFYSPIQYGFWYRFGTLWRTSASSISRFRPGFPGWILSIVGEPGRVCSCWHKRKIIISSELSYCSQAPILHKSKLDFPRNRKQ